VLGRGNGGCRGADFRDDRLRGIDPKARDFGEALHCVMMDRKQVGHLLIELSEVILDHGQLFRVSFSSRR
jgi:hypothetical protein